MSKNQRMYYRYSNCFKEKVVLEVSAGRSISEVCRYYGIKGMSMVQRWLSKESLHTVIRVKMRSEEDRIKELEADNRRLKIALADAVLAKDILKCLTEEADSRYGTNIKKINRPSVFGIKTLSGKRYVLVNC